MIEAGDRGELHRTIVVGLVWNRRGELLFCRMDPDRGVFPGQWGFPGGGIEPGERMEPALRRELREEIGVEVEEIRPAFFKDCSHRKTFADGTVRPVYMIFLLFHCTAVDEELNLNDEFVEYRWVAEGETNELDLNDETIDTLRRLGPWRGSAASEAASEDPVPGSRGSLPPAPEGSRSSAYLVAFEAVPWESPTAGMRFKASLHGDRRLRLVEYTPEMAEHWCDEGHDGCVLEGRLEVRFPGGSVEYGPGDGVAIPAGPEHRHLGRALTDRVRVLFFEEVP